jgi:predicted membrane protein (TIGR00267 family)
MKSLANIKTENAKTGKNLKNETLKRRGFLSRLNSLILSMLEGGSFGIVDGVICSFGLIIGLAAATYNPTLIFVSGLLAGLSDSFGNSIGFFFSQKSERTVQIVRKRKGMQEHVHTKRELLTSGLSSFLTTFLIYAIMLIPFLFLDIVSALLFSISFAIAVLFLLGAYNAYLLKENTKNMIKEGLLYVGVCLITAVISYFVGSLLNNFILA